MFSNLDNIEFAYPYAFFGLLLLPVIIIWHIKYDVARRSSFTITTTHFLIRGKSFRRRLYPLLFVTRCLALALLIVVIARPQLRLQKKVIDGEGIDIMLCIDVSGSMKTEDIMPTRVGAAMNIAKGFIRARVGDQVGLVVFSGISLTLCPLTLDTNATLNQANNMTNPLFSKSGTIIGSGIATCINDLQNSPQKTKIIILLSDGVNSEDAISPLVSATLAKALNIKIYTIGVGTNNALTRRTIQNSNAGPPIYIESTQKLNDTLLTAVSSATGGRYFNATGKESLKNAFETINKLEKSKITILNYTSVIDKFVPFLSMSFLLILAEMLLRYSIFRRFP